MNEASTAAPLELPPMSEAVIDLATLRALAADLLACAQIDAVQVKQAARTHVIQQRWTLDEALAALIEGQVRGVQIQYRYEGHAWTDTLLRFPAGYKLIRCRHLA